MLGNIQEHVEQAEPNILLVLPWKTITPVTYCCCGNDLALVSLLSWWAGGVGWALCPAVWRSRGRLVSLGCGLPWWCAAGGVWLVLVGSYTCDSYTYGADEGADGGG